MGRAGAESVSSVVMASRSTSRSQWRKPSLLHKYVKNKAKRGSKTFRKKPTSFSVTIPSVHTQGGQADNPPSHGHTGADMDMDGGALPDVDSDNDHEPTRCGDL